MKKAYYTLHFFIFYLAQLVQSNLYIAFDILTPKSRISPGFIWVPVTIKSDFGLLLFTNLLSMTPGTLSIDLTEDKQQLLVHYLYNNKKKSILQEVNAIQDKIKRIVN